MDETYVGGKQVPTVRAKWQKPGLHGPIPGRFLGSLTRRRPSSAWSSATTRCGMDGKTKPDRHQATARSLLTWCPKRCNRGVVQPHGRPDQGRGHASTPMIPACTTGWTKAAGSTTRCAIAGVRTWRNYHIHTQQIEGFWSLVKRGISRHPPRRVPEVATGLRERVRLAIQPPRQRQGDVLGATAPVRFSGAVGPAL